MPFLSFHGPAGSASLKFQISNLLSLFVSISGIEEPRLIEMIGDELEADRQSGARSATWNADRGHPREIDRHRVDIAQIHGQRIVRLLADLEWRGGRGRRGNDVALLEGLGEVIDQHLANALRLFVV